ncbi:MAG: YggS family pyridoxal phosphate-dependent enzyme [Burkholderiaceae bacterium]|nr:YggS family pyridoxal phosphate-dependent enzyme [Burkholderiaceae bacterium]
MTMIADKLQSVHARIAAACAAAGRDPRSVALLAVSKTQGPQAVREAAAQGQSAFGENYIQEAIEKILTLADLHLQWHCIGPVQSNKTRLVAEHFSWVHTVDRLKIAQRLSEQRPAHLPPLQVCLQVNIDGSDSKAGVPPGEALALARQVAVLSRLELRGLMTIPQPSKDPALQKAVHERTRRLFDQILLAQPPGLQRWDTLSMGMTDDLEAAIAAGSTLVRVGTAIFGARPRLTRGETA